MISFRKNTPTAGCRLDRRRQKSEHGLPVRRLFQEPSAVDKSVKIQDVFWVKMIRIANRSKYKGKRGSKMIHSFLF